MANGRQNRETRGCAYFTEVLDMRVRDKDIIYNIDEIEEIMKKLFQLNLWFDKRYLNATLINQVLKMYITGELLKRVQDIIDLVVPDDFRIPNYKKKIKEKGILKWIRRWIG